MTVQMVTWASENRGTEDLVVLGITDIEGGPTAVDAVKKLLRDRNIHFITGKEDMLMANHESWFADCSQLKGETAGSVTKHFTLPTGGRCAYDSACITVQPVTASGRQH